MTSKLNGPHGDTPQMWNGPDIDLNLFFTANHISRKTGAGIVDPLRAGLSKTFALHEENGLVLNACKNNP